MAMGSELKLRIKVVKKVILRAIRKTSNVTKRAGLKGVNFLGKVENKTTFLINNGKLGDSVKAEDLFYQKYQAEPLILLLFLFHLTKHQVVLHHV